MRATDGRLLFVDLGRAIIHEKENVFFYRDAGHELAKLGREGFKWNKQHRIAFRKHYLAEMNYSQPALFMVIASFRICITMRFIRKTIQLKSPWS